MQWRLPQRRKLVTALPKPQITKGLPVQPHHKKKKMPGPKQRHSSPSGAEKAAKDQRRRATAPAAPTTIDTDSTPSTPRPAEPADAGESAWANGRLVELLHEGDGAAAINHVNAHVATCPSLARTAMDTKTTRSALHVAAAAGQPAVVRRLIAAGADPARRDKFGKTALHAACERGQGKVVDALLEIGGGGAGDAARDSKLAQLLRAGPAKQPPIHLAAKNDDAAICLQLLKAGARPDEPAPADGRTALHVCARFDSARCAAVLLDWAADPLAASTVPPYHNPLHVAASHNAERVAQLLVDRGGDFHGPTKPPKGYAGPLPTPCELAVACGHRALARNCGAAAREKRAQQHHDLEEANAEYSRVAGRIAAARRERDTAARRFDDTQRSYEMYASENAAGIRASVGTPSGSSRPSSSLPSSRPSSRPSRPSSRPSSRPASSGLNRASA